MRASIPLASIVFAALALGACSESDSPGGALSPSPVAGEGASSLARTSSSTGPIIDAEDSTAEQFGCATLTEVRQRFGAPGFIDRDRVGMFLRYGGLPEGESFIEVIWDEENAPGAIERIFLADLLVPQGDSGLFGVELLLEHRYPGIDSDMSRRVRVTLFLEGVTGSCARVRHIVVGPDIQSGSVSFPPPSETPFTFGADIAITATPSLDPVDVSTPLAFSVSVTNQGPEPATGVSFRATLPGGFGYTGSTNPNGACGLSGSTVTCSLGSLASGVGVVVTMNVLSPSAVGNYGFTFAARRNEVDPNGVNDTLTHSVSVTNSGR